MIAAHIDKGDILRFPTGDTYIVTRVVTKRQRPGRVDMTVLHCDRTNGTSIQFHVPADDDFDRDGIEIFEGCDRSCESCDAFLHEDNPGSLNREVGAYFCSTGAGCNKVRVH